MRLFITADDHNMTVYPCNCAANMDLFERRLWPSFRKIRSEAQMAAEKRKRAEKK